MTLDGPYTFTCLIRKTDFLPGKGMVDSRVSGVVYVDLPDPESTTPESTPLSLFLFCEHVPVSLFSIRSSGVGDTTHERRPPGRENRQK